MFSVSAPSTFVGAADLKVILEVFADARQVADRVDPKRLQALAIADAGPLPRIAGGSDRAARQHDLSAGEGDVSLSVNVELHAGGAAVLDGDATHQGMGLQPEVRPAQSGMQEGVRRAPSPAMLLGDLEI